MLSTDLVSNAILEDYYMNNLQSSSVSRQQDSLPSSISSGSRQDFISSETATVEYSGIPALEDLDEISIAIVEVIEEKGPLLAREIMDLLHMSRAPVSTRLKKMSEQDILTRYAKPGTEQKVHPTYIYELSVKTLEELANSQEALSAFAKNESSSSGLEKEKTIAVMAELLEISIQEIAKLRERVSKLESALNFHVTLDREELLNKLKSQ